MKALFFIPLVVMAAGCLAAPVLVICSRRRAYESWAKVTYILIGVFGLIWTGLESAVLLLGDAAFGPIGVALSHVRTLIGGVCIGLTIAVVIARPYKSVPNERTQTAV
jgi:hypothetical protein